MTRGCGLSRSKEAAGAFSPGPKAGLKLCNTPHPTHNLYQPKLTGSNSILSNISMFIYRSIREVLIDIFFVVFGKCTQECPNIGLLILVKFFVKQDCFLVFFERSARYDSKKQRTL